MDRGVVRCDHPGGASAGDRVRHAMVNVRRLALRCLPRRCGCASYRFEVTGLDASVAYDEPLAGGDAGGAVQEVAGEGDEGSGCSEDLHTAVAVLGGDEPGL